MSTYNNRILLFIYNVKATAIDDWSLEVRQLCRVDYNLEVTLVIMT